MAGSRVPRWRRSRAWLTAAGQLPGWCVAQTSDSVALNLRIWIRCPSPAPAQHFDHTVAKPYRLKDQGAVMHPYLECQHIKNLPLMLLPASARQAGAGCIDVPSAVTVQLGQYIYCHTCLFSHRSYTIAYTTFPNDHLVYSCSPRRLLGDLSHICSSRSINEGSRCLCRHDGT